MRLKRRGLMQGYIKVPEKSKNGKQHVHVLFRGSYIDQALISAWWLELHSAKVVDIRAVKKTMGKHALASYMAKYMSKENLYRYSWNWGWVWRGFVKDWTRLKKLVGHYNDSGCYIGFDVVIKCWRMWLKGTWQPDFTPLQELT